MTYFGSNYKDTNKRVVGVVVRNRAKLDDCAPVFPYAATVVLYNLQRRKSTACPYETVIYTWDNFP